MGECIDGRLGILESINCVDVISAELPCTAFTGESFPGKCVTCIKQTPRHFKFDPEIRTWHEPTGKRKGSLSA